MLKKSPLFILILMWLVGTVQAQTPQASPAEDQAPVTIDLSIQKIMQDHFRAGMKAFSADDYETALKELKASTAVKTKFDWQTWYPSAYKTLGVLYEFHSQDPQHKTLAYMYYAMAKQLEPGDAAEGHYLKDVQDSKGDAQKMMASSKESTEMMLDDESSQPHWVAPPSPRADSRNLSFDIYSVYEDAVAGPQLSTLGDLYARRKLDDQSTTADLQVRFSKNLSTSDSANEVDLRLARITYIEPWLQLSVGRMDIFPTLTPMNFFGAYPDMGVHRVDGAMASIPIYFEMGSKGDGVLPTALTVFYTPSLLEAGNVTIDTQQSFLLTQARARIDFFGLRSVWAANLGWTSTDYFTYSSLNGGSSLSATGDISVDKELDLYGEFAAQNTSLFTSTDVLGLGLKIQKIRTWGAVSIDEICVEGQAPLENDPNNVFSGANPFNSSLASNSMVTWFGSVKARVRAVTLTFAVTNNMDDFTLGRLNSTNTSIATPIGPGRELEKSQIPLVAASYTQPAFLGSISVDF